MLAGENQPARFLSQRKKYMGTLRNYLDKENERNYELLITWIIPAPKRKTEDIGQRENNIYIKVAIPLFKE